MALFTDGPISNAVDLQRYENAILSVASTESIDLGAKLMLAQQDLANQVTLLLSRRLPLSDYPLGLRQFRSVKDVVVTEALRQWHVYKTLDLVYRDAYNNQLNDRYQGKWTEYERLAKASQQTYFKIGVGLVTDPVPKAAAPTLSTVAGNAAGSTFYVAVTWVNMSGQEGAPSDVATLSTSDGQQIVATVSGVPPNVGGWNVYAGTSPTTLSQQNSSSLAIISSWTMTSGIISGAPLPAGQRPAYFVLDDHVIQRG